MGAFCDIISNKYFNTVHNESCAGENVKKIKADGILFDLDGTLWDSTEPAAVVWKEVASRNPEITDEITGPILKTFYGLPLEDIARGMFKSVSYETALATMEVCVVEQCPYLIEHKGELLGDIRATFEKLRAAGHKIFIVSNCRAGYIEAFLEGHGFEDLVDDHLCPGDTGELKAANILKTVEKWGLKAPVYVGDTHGDETAAAEAGVPFIFAGYGFGTVEKCEAELGKIEELPELLESV